MVDMATGKTRAVGCFCFRKYGQPSFCQQHYFSITLWEISLKYALGKLTLGCKPDDLLKIIDDMGFEKLILSHKEAALFYQLPKFAHKDPFDRMLIWQAVSNDLILISKDGQFDQYSQYGLNVIW